MALNRESTTPLVAIPALKMAVVQQHLSSQSPMTLNAVIAMCSPPAMIRYLSSPCVAVKFHCIVFKFKLIYLHRLRNKLSAYINHARCLLPVDLTSTRTVCVEKSQSQDPLITGLEPGPLIREVDALPLHHCLPHIVFKIANSG